jgi:catechol 2,3-dioxygenase-like lactoylglutathione lyase family enzyme
VGIHHLKIPVIDLARSRAWYQRVFGLQVAWEVPGADGAVRGVVGEVPGLGDVLMALREHTPAALGCRGFDPVSFAVRDPTTLQAWADHLDDLGIRHSPVIEASIGWLLAFNDPDGLDLHLYSRA